MPNYVNTTITINVPSQKRDALLAALEGPRDWFYPLAALHDFERPKLNLNNHERLAIEAKMKKSEEVIQAFKDEMVPLGWPEEMKPSAQDIEVFLAGAVDRGAQVTVPFSVAKLSPYAEGEVAMFFPDPTPEAPYWTCTSTNESRIIPLRMHKLGVKWPPSDISRDVEDDDERQISMVTIRFTTPWGNVSNIVELMTKVLTDHDAKMLVVWDEEQGFCGYTYFDPADPDAMQDEDYDADNQWMVEEEEDGETYTRFDRIAFETDVAEMLEAPGFLLAA